MANRRGGPNRRPPASPTAHKPHQQKRRTERAAAAAKAGAGLGPGEWLWACRPGYENDLVEELQLVLGPSALAERLATGLVRSTKRPRGPDGEHIELTFARQGFPVTAVVEGTDPGLLAGAVAAALRGQLGGDQPLAVQVFVADSDESNPLAGRAALLEERLLQLIPHAATRVVPPGELAAGKAHFVQVCLLDALHAAAGALPVGHAVSHAVGGRRRIGTPTQAPSRAASKLLEAFDWLGRAPDSGDVCVDLGAAPGGWSHVLLERRAQVIAVDPAPLDPALARRRGLTHVKQNAFEFNLSEPVEWLCCDMAYRPLEVAAMLAKWGRRNGARFLVANIKMPMKKKVDMIRRIKEILETGGWRNLRVRQLYHDRDEITLGAWHLGGFGADKEEKERRPRRGPPKPGPGVSGGRRRQGQKERVRAPRPRR